MPLQLPRFVPPDQSAAQKIVTPSRPFVQPERNQNRSDILEAAHLAQLGRFMKSFGNATLGLVFGLPDRHGDDSLSAPEDRHAG